MNDIERLRVLLPHWIGHNAEHANEFRTWAKKARTASDERLAKHIEAAAQKMEAANHDFQGAIEHLGVDPHGHAHLHHDHHHHDHAH